MIKLFSLFLVCVGIYDRQETDGVLLVLLREAIREGSIEVVGGN